MNNIFIVIPTLDPDEKIMSKFLTKLKREFKNILVINDGSNKIHDDYFKKMEKDGIKVLKHYKNYGKGRALKNAFNYLLNNYPKLEGVVTCDSDGQHSVKDIKKCAESLLINPDDLVLGVRNFDEDNVPPKSKFGNKITRTIFKSFIGLDITDTQTGLRGIGRDIMYEFLDINGERYEYETNMLIACKTNHIKIKEIEIDTIYIDGNSMSHFNPINDSIKIYKLFSKSLFLALSSYIIDIIIFLFVFNLLSIQTRILAATIIARSISSIYNYFINSKLKFKNFNIKMKYKYITLTIIQMFLSGCFIMYIYNLVASNLLLIKIIIDLIVWIINVLIQNEFKIEEDDYE